jgi:RimJ/RimL family protein N-acetyltransferase
VAVEWIPGNTAKWTHADGVRLRPLQAEDLSRLVAWDAAPEVQYHMGRRFLSPADARAWWETLRPRYGRIGFAILADERLVGDLELEHIGWRRGEAELRICIGDQTQWGRGIGTAALQHLMIHAFRTMQLDRIYLRVTTDNVRAIRLYEKCGFHKHARLASTGRLSGARPVWLMELCARDYACPGTMEKAVRAGPASTDRL